MKINILWLFPAGILGVIVMGFVSNTLFVKSEPPSCEELRIDILSFEKCLKYQPACQMTDGHQKFIDYHTNRDIYEAVCGEDRADALQSEINDDNEVMSNE